MKTQYYYNMFEILHLDLYSTIFDYLSQQELLSIVFVDRMFYQQIMKYIDNTRFVDFDHVIYHVKFDETYGYTTTFEDIENIENKITEVVAKFNIISFLKKADYSYDDVFVACFIRNCKLTMKALLSSKISNDDIGIIFNIACRGGALPIVEEIYGIADEEWIANKRSEGSWALFNACCWGRQNVVDFLLSKNIKYCSCNIHYTNHP